jgi:hypothetical protein
MRHAFGEPRMKSLSVWIAWLAFSLPALAQGWQEYRDPDMGFAASFPGTPAVSDIVYKTADGTALSAKLYALRKGSSEYRVIVADFSNAALQGDAAISDAEKVMSASGRVTVAIDARVNRNYGRQLGVTAPDGTSSVAAIFFVNHRLYEIEGLTHPAQDADSSNAARFQQSLNFLGGGFGGRGRRGFGP